MESVLLVFGINRLNAESRCNALVLGADLRQVEYQPNGALLYNWAYQNEMPVGFISR